MENFKWNLVDIIKVLRKFYLLIFGVVICFVGLGFIFVLVQKNKYQSSVKILPELESSSSLGNLSGLAGIAGIDISSVSKNEAISPDLYPNVLKSSFFFNELMNLNLSEHNQPKFLFWEYVQSNYSESFELIGKEEDYQIFDKDYSKVIDLLIKDINATYDIKTGIIVISAKMYDPVIAAKVTTFSYDFLTSFILDYRMQKLVNEKNFIELSLKDAEKIYLKSQKRMFKFDDLNSLGTTRLSFNSVEKEKLETDYQISKKVYLDLLNAHEDVKLRIKKQTPTFKIIEPVAINLDPVEPNKLLIITLFIFIGISVAVLLIVLKNSKVIN